MRIVLLGPPGAGKGTQGKRLADRYGLALVATGDIFRELPADSEMGRKVRSYMERGELVPDDVVIRVVLGRLEEPDARRGFVLDGFPRTVPQSHALEDALAAVGRPLSAALSFAVADDVAVKRLAARLTCPSCKRTYNVATRPPQVDGVCDVCGASLVRRDDDDDTTVRRRLDVYRRDTQPLRSHFAERGLLREVDADGTEDEVAGRTIEAIADLEDALA